MKLYKKIIVSVIVVTGSMHSQTGLSQGTYVEGNIGAHDGVLHSAGIGANINVGYQFSHYVASEIGYVSYSGRLNAIDLAAKGIFPLKLGQYGASLFGKLGGMYGWDRKGSGLAPLLGIGASYGLSPILDLNVQAQGIINGDVGGLFSFGLTYHPAR